MIAMIATIAVAKIATIARVVSIMIATIVATAIGESATEKYHENTSSNTTSFPGSFRHEPRTSLFAGAKLVFKISQIFLAWHEIRRRSPLSIAITRGACKPITQKLTRAATLLDKLEKGKSDYFHSKCTKPVLEKLFDDF